MASNVIFERISERTVASPHPGRVFLLIRLCQIRVGGNNCGNGAVILRCFPAHRQPLHLTFYPCHPCHQRRTMVMIDALSTTLLSPLSFSLCFFFFLSLFLSLSLSLFFFCFVFWFGRIQLGHLEVCQKPEGNQFLPTANLPCFMASVHIVTSPNRTPI